MKMSKANERMDRRPIRLAHSSSEKAALIAVVVGGFNPPPSPFDHVLLPV
jgi:hypothetical protein